MNSIKRKAERKKRTLHHLKQSAKPKVKAMCAMKGIEFARMELQKNGPLVVWDTSGNAHMIVMNETR